MNVTQDQQQFILQVGEVGSRWGINRTVGQIHALLYLSKLPLNADDIVRDAQVDSSVISRPPSNAASTLLRRFVRQVQHRH